MDISGILTKIDQELAALQSARAAIASLASAEISTAVRRGPGRPPKSLSVAATPKVKKRKLSAAGRARIAEAQKARWAARKAVAAAPAAASPTAEVGSVRTANKKTTKFLIKKEVRK